MARHIWVISPSLSPLEGENPEATASKPREGGKTVGRRFDRLRPKAKKHEAPEPLPTTLVSLSEEGMHAAPDNVPTSRRSEHS
jgi:hypothetical protein